MKSNVCKIEKGNSALSAIRHESQKVADYNAFTNKQALQLRLLCEELDGMLPRLMDNYEGEFWIDYEGNVCKITASIKLSELTANKKKELISLSKNKKNAASVGIVGKIRSVIENFFLDEEKLQNYNISTSMYNYPADCGVGVDYSCLWSLSQYKSTVKQQAKEESWDELEKSIIASLADDVIVGVKGKQASIVVIKKFA